MSNKPRYTLHMFIEQGSEGAHWSIYDNTKTGYEGLIDVSEGMVLNIPGVWSGTIKRKIPITIPCHLSVPVVAM